MIKIIICDIYPGSSTHAEVVFRRVLHPIELEFRNIGLNGHKSEIEPRPHWFEASAITKYYAILTPLIPHHVIKNLLYIHNMHIGFQLNVYFKTRHVSSGAYAYASSKELCCLIV